MNSSITVQATTRIAPSPTGHLHLGHVVHLLWLSAIARQKKASIKIRLEDHDRARCKPEFTASIASDLHFLSLSPYSDIRCFDSIQSSHDRQLRYLDVYRNLYEKNLLYACHCTRKDYQPILGSTELRYPGHCCEKGLKLPSPDELADDTSPTPFTIRLKLPEKEFSFLEQHNSQIIREKPRSTYGDPVIRDRSGQWTYQYCVVIDDMDEAINLIVRGADLQASTSRQLAFHQILCNQTSISFFHHPLMLDSRGRKLSKTEKSPPIYLLRSSGMSKEQIFGEALGITESLSLSDCCDLIEQNLEATS